MTNTIYTVYKTTNLINNKIYIGVHTTTNPNDDYMGSGIAIKSAIKKYGKYNFKKEIIFEYDNSEDMFKKEIELVNEKFVNRNDTYNLTGGGYGCSHITDDVKRKLSLKGYCRTHTQETKDKISKLTSGENNPRFGCHLSEKHKLKLSKSNTGKKNCQFSGYFITPWGKFETSIKAHNNNPIIPRTTIFKWCKHNDMIITERNMRKSKYLKSLKDNPIGKTVKGLGFYFT